MLKKLLSGMLCLMLLAGALAGAWADGDYVVTNGILSA